jgi:hypothetical protein
MQQSHWSCAAALAALLGACSDRAESDRAIRPHVASPSCPLQTPSDWQSFLETTVEEETWVKTCSDSDNCVELVGSFAGRVQTDVLGLFERCDRDLADNPRIFECTERLRHFVPAWLEQHASHSYGFRQENRSYLEAQTSAGLPSGMMDPPAELLAALPDRAAFEATARRQGWPYLTHDSGLGGVRTFVAVSDPAGRYDQWLLVGLDESAEAVRNPSVMSFIGVQKKDVTGADLQRVRLHFRDYWLEKAEDTWQLELPELHDGKCYSCHVSGLRLLLPSRGNVMASEPVNGEAGYGDPRVSEDFGAARLSSMNERLLSYGLPDWNDTLEPADHGPALGQPLGCTTCHDGQTRGMLSVSTNEHLLQQKLLDELSMQSFGAGQSVPDEAAMQLLERERTGTPALAADELRELEHARARHLADYRAFMADRLPAWQAWVLERPCE